MHRFIFNSRGFFGIGVVKIIIILFLINILGQGIYIFSTKKTATIEVTGTEVKRYDETDKYLIFTKEHGVMENTDALFVLKFNSSDIQAKLSQKGSYKIDYYGMRVPFLSLYPNIISAVEVNQQEVSQKAN